jgi:hypothetical protein
MDQIEINENFERVFRFVQETDKLIFLTGKAGTGKTTALRYIRDNTFKQIAVIAPTGVAAINAGGTTIHSFFQFPFSPFVPAINDKGDIDIYASKLPESKLNSKRLNIFRNLDLLIIDEVSMLRADLLDQIDLTLRKTRRQMMKPFGGVQVLLIGDLHQLPPVIKNEEWGILQNIYPGPFFFDSFVIRHNAPVYLELDKVYRQSEDVFLDLLNKVRHNTLDAHSLEALNARYRSGLTDDDYRNNITLTTHNHKADAINTRNLNAIDAKTHRFKAIVKDTFSPSSYPAEEELVLKTGCRVMFLKNNYDKNYYNGKTGEITKIETDKIYVKCPDDVQPITVERESWSNVAYSVDRTSKRVTEEIIGEFVQFPLRLAWAITIHKSQGLTFSNLIIDAAEAFAAGQVYVALSRCRTLQGLILSSKITTAALANDRSVVDFSRKREDDHVLQNIFSNSRSSYLSTILTGLFDFSELHELRRQLAAHCQMYDSRVRDTEGWKGRYFAVADQIYDVSSKFLKQLGGLTSGSADPQNDSFLQERIKKAAGFFVPEVEKSLLLLKECRLFTESREASDEINPTLQDLYEKTFEKIHLLRHILKNGFEFAQFVKQKLGIKMPEVRINIYATAKNSRMAANSVHPELYRKLLMLRDEICNEEEAPVHMVANAASLAALSNFLPTTTDELLLMPGFGKARAQMYGRRFLAVINAYIKDNDILSREEIPVKKKKSVKSNGNARKPGKALPTKEVSFQMFKQGLSVPEIAKQRGYTQGTIETHLSSFISSGEIDIDKVLKADKKEIILKALENFDPAGGLGAVKHKLPESVTWTDIKYAMAFKKRLAEQS